jgi:hypothetical protein
MEIALSIALGVGLAAAAGFRVFVPLLLASLASLAGYLPLSPGFEWIGSVPAAIAFGTATVLEILAYYIPWLDNILDSIATPAAVVAGIVAAASTLTEVTPLLRWIVAIVGGGGVAGMVQGATVLARVKSTALTGGIGNAVVSTAELFGSVVTSLLAILVPAIAVLVIGVILIVAFFSARRILFGRSRP